MTAVQPPAGERPEPPGSGDMVVPPGPLDIGDLYGGAIAILRRNLLATVGVAVAAQFAATVVGTVVTALYLDKLPDLDQLTRDDVTTIIVTGGIVAIVTTLLALISIVVVPVVVQRAVRGQRTSAADAVSDGATHMVRMIGLYALLVVGVVAAVVVAAVFSLVSDATAVVVLLVLLVAGVYVYVRVSVSLAALVQERLGPVAALRRSWSLVHGSWWRVFGIVLLTVLIYTAIDSIPDLIFGSDASGPLLILSSALEVLLRGLELPFFGVVLNLLFVDLVRRRELSPT